ncbi:hypothetical protein SapgrDRAFT_0512 [Saprospira grandis DSM 2844]|uniref:Thioesterase domain-containing protein n=1 Tax=Saprospira grandis DSM 2844 TaxID=694433 RepID=J0XTL4_9BACT|nr:hotdog fold thioesterase [Saprospira grandis]EJF52256.1 hypothetical protein SapgrDRAFT_0512 [Saprospira grandis DSM 2844]
MSIWRRTASLAQLNQLSENTVVSYLGIEFIEIGEDYLKARMPVTANQVQPARILHGGVSVVLAETLGSVASVLCIDEDSGKQPVGLEINASHLRSVPEGGEVVGICRPIRIGRQVHFWEIELQDQKGRPICSSRLTVMLRDAK